MRILSLDGGGVKGVLQAKILERLDDATGFVSSVDLFAGTSVGAISALYLASGGTAGSLVRELRRSARDVFGGRAEHGTMEEFLGASRAAAALRGLLEEAFGDKRVSELPRDVFVMAYDLIAMRPRVITRRDDMRIVDAALASSAAPLYLPVHLVKGHGSMALIDGGVFANNPSLKALDHLKRDDKATLLSIGAGRPVQDPQRPARRPSLLNVLFDGMESMAHAWCQRRLEKNKYFRLQPDLLEEVGLDDVEKVPALVHQGENMDLEDAETWIKLRWIGLED